MPAWNPNFVLFQNCYPRSVVSCYHFSAFNVDAFIQRLLTAEQDDFRTGTGCASQGQGVVSIENGVIIRRLVCKNLILCRCILIYAAMAIKMILFDVEYHADLGGKIDRGLQLET